MKADSASPVLQWKSQSTEQALAGLAEAAALAQQEEENSDYENAMDYLESPYPTDPVMTVAEIK